jgi:pimeloyl-ACP methyl ester carboxylesterase
MGPLALVLTMFATAACSENRVSPASSTPPSSALPVSSTPSPTSPIEWKKCGDIECAEIRVPLDYGDPTAGETTIPLSLLRGTDRNKRIGVLLVNPGGPGAPGTSMAQNAAYYFSREILDSFDIVGWDPRGTGSSDTAVDCIDDYSTYFRQPFTANSAREFIAACTTQSGDHLDVVDTVSSARDIEQIRIALGEDTISYFGFSYGGLLGATWASLYPRTVRAAVLDAPPSPTATRVERLTAQARGFEQQLDRLLATYTLASRIDELLTTPPQPLTPHMVRAAIVSALYDEESWMVLSDAIEAISEGDTQPLMDMYNGYYYQDPGYEDYRNVFEASVAIACLDDANRQQVPDLTDIAPRLGSFFSPDHLCTQWPVPPAAKVDISAPTKAPIVVIGATGDPATPVDGATDMKATLGNAVMITVETNRHTTYLANECVTKIVDRYLVEGATPKDSRC